MELGTADAMIERRYFRSRSTNLWRRACPAAVGSRRPRWERIIEKFHWLSEMFADAGLRSQIIKVVDELDARPISDLTALLSKVRPETTFAATHPGIQ